MRKKMQWKDRMKAAILSVLVLLVLFLAGCGMTRERVWEKYVDTGIADRTGHTMDGGLLLAKGEDWRRIVTNSPFQLGEEFTDPSTLVKSVDNGAYPLLHGSYAMYPLHPLFAEFARQHLDLSDADIYGEESVYGYFDAGFVRYGTPYLSSRERYLGSKSTGPSLRFELDKYGTGNSGAETGDPFPKGNVKQAVCYDALLFYTHRDNPVDSLTLKEIRKIFSGEITNWREVGGDNKRIEIYQREEGSNTQEFMEKKMMVGLKMLPPKELSVDIGGKEGGLYSVYEYVNKPASIGYTLNIYYDKVYQNGGDEKMKETKILSVDGIAPTAENLRNGAYPATVGIYAGFENYTLEHAKKSADFLLWILSPEGQACVEQAGYTTLR